MLQFVPSTVTIKKGDTVKWANNKMSPHNVVFENDADKSHKNLVFSPRRKATRLLLMKLANILTTVSLIVVREW